MSGRQRSFWGWGYSDQTISEDFVDHFKATVKMALGLGEREELPPPSLGELQLRSSRFEIPSSLESFCTNAVYDRAAHSYGKSYRDVVRALNGNFDNPPDYVAYPGDEADIVALMAFCQTHQVALIPYGGGSSVTGGVEPTRSDRFQGVITADLKHLDQILEIDPISRTGRIQAGIYGPALEAGLKPHGLTLRHFPQSFEFSTLGGWIATHAGGHFATLYTHIDEFVQSVRLVTPRGVVETRRLPGSGAVPNPERHFIGSEGIFGIITEAWMRLQNVPKYRAKATVSFVNEQDGIAAVRHLSQSGLYPANCRLVSALEAYSTGLGQGTDTVLLLGFESHNHPVVAWLDYALAICGRHSGRWQSDEISSEAEGQKRGSGEDAWRRAFMQAPYLRDRLAMAGLIIETFETAVTWDQFDTLHQAVQAATMTAIQTECGTGLITWRFTHVYPDGPAPYYTVIAAGERGRELKQWDAIKSAATETILAHGGTVTHHHAVGKDQRRWYELERDPLFGEVLASSKRTLDPQWILNPGVLITAGVADRD
jgi:alkyldihydroxyacetonephosphate synthase